MCLSIFFFNDTATTEIYTYLHTLSLHDALPIYPAAGADLGQARRHEQSEAFADHSRRREEFADRAPVGSLIPGLLFQLTLRGTFGTFRDSFVPDQPRRQLQALALQRHAILIAQDHMEPIRRLPEREDLGRESRRE